MPRRTAINFLLWSVREQSPTGPLGYGSGEQRELLPVHELQQPGSRVVDEVQEVWADVEHLREWAQIGCTHAHAERMEGYRPELSGIPAVLISASK